MSCGDGTGAYVGFTVTADAMCRAVGDAGEQVAETQALIRTATDAITVSTVVKYKSIGPWESNVESVGSPNVEDGCGSLDRMHKGCGRTNPEWVAVLDYSGNYPLEALVGAEGTIRRWNPDGSYREATGWVSGATVIPNHASGEENTGELRFQWEGGKQGDPGFVKMYDASDVEQWPTMPAAA